MDFQRSARLRELLRYIVECSQQDPPVILSEQQIGSAVFGRPPEYDTSSDTIVRVQISQLRRRLEHYYLTEGQGEVIRIEIPRGSYSAVFRSVEQAGEDTAQPAVVTEVSAQGRLEPAGDAAAATEAPRRSRRGYWTAAVAAGLLLAGAWTIHQLTRTSDDVFWSAALAQGSPIICLPESQTVQLPRALMRDLASAPTDTVVKLRPNEILRFQNWHTSLPVLQAALAVSSVLQRNGRPPAVRVGADLKMDEVRGRLVVAIGSFSNPWVQASVADLRFRYDRGAGDNEAPSIRDSRNPSRVWSLASTYPAAQDKDYAIITRTFDRGSGGVFVSLAGLHSFGNQMAGDFVSDPALQKMLAARAPRGWERMNLQVVLHARIVGTTPTAPTIVDKHFW